MRIVIRAPNDFIIDRFDTTLRIDFSLLRYR